MPWPMIVSPEANLCRNHGNAYPACNLYKGVPGGFAHIRLMHHTQPVLVELLQVFHVPLDLETIKEAGFKHAADAFKAALGPH